MARRYFTNEINHGIARLTGQEAHHLAIVLRAKIGQTVQLCSGTGTDYEAVITDILPDEILFAVTSSQKSKAEPSQWAEVFIGMAKGERMDFAVQKVVELGASVICPFYSEFAVVKPKNDSAKTQRFARIAKEAAKQSGRALLPEVKHPLNFSGMLKQASACEKALFFYEEGGIALNKAINGKEKAIAIITGAEGGFSLKEAAAARAAGFCIVGLGPRILRCETAPVAALAATMLLSGNLC